MDEDIINTDEYLDAHPALSFALNEAMERQLFVIHVFADNPQRRVYRDWRDPEKRAAMEREFLEAEKNKRSKVVTDASGVEADEPVPEPPALIHALNEAMLKNSGKPALQGMAEMRIYRAWDDPESRAEMERAYDEHVSGRQ